MKNGKRMVYYLAAVSFLNDISSEILSAILPFFLSSLGASGAVLGLVGGARKALARGMQIVFGYLSDKFRKRKIFVIAGYAISAVFKFFLFFAHSWIIAGALSVAERLGKAIRTAPRDAMIAECMPKERGKGFGIHRAFDTLGAIIGSVLAFFLIHVLDLDFHTTILLSSILAFAALLPFKFVKDVRPRKKAKSFFFSLAGLSREFKIFLLISQPFFFASFSYMFLLLYAKEITNLGNALGLYILFNIAYAIFSAPSGMIADKIGRKTMLAIGYFLYSVVLLLFIFASNLELLLVLFFLYGICYAILEVNQKAFVSELAKLKSTALGAYNTMSGFSLILAGVIAGTLWDISKQVLFLYGSVLSMLACVLLLICSKSQDEEGKLSKIL